MLKRRWVSLAGAAAFVVVVVLVVLGLSGFFEGSRDTGNGGREPGLLDPPDGIMYGEYWWGEGRTIAPAGEFVDVAAIELMSCGVGVGGELVCWGQVEFELPQGEFS